MKSIIDSNLRETEQSETLFVNELSQTKASKGELVYRFGFGQSPFYPPQNVIDVVKSEAHRKEYMNVQGNPNLRKAVAAFHNDIDDLSILSDNVIIGPGSKMLIYCVMACFREADVFLVTPSWVSYEPQAKLAGHPVTRIQTRFEDRWRLTPELLTSACVSRKDTSKPIIMVLNYPGNPDGLTYSELELKAIAEVARKYEILVISDEIYGLLNHTGTHSSLAKYYPEGTIVTTGLSKWCGAGGWRLGVALLPSSLGGSFKECLVGIASETYSCVTCAIQEAAILAYQNTPEINQYLAHQRRILSLAGIYTYNTLKEKGVWVHPPEGGFYLNPDFTSHQEKLRTIGITTSDELCTKLLDETGVVLLPGSAFGYPADQLVTRLAFVDFDGKEALAASEALGLDVDIDHEFLMTYMPKVAHGVSKLAEWIPS